LAGKEDLMKRRVRSPDIAWIAADLAPGDAAVAGFDRSSILVRRIRSPDDPRFAAAYERLWSEFGDRREMEAREVIVMTHISSDTGHGHCSRSRNVS
jgi:hypothetical protein